MTAITIAGVFFFSFKVEKTLRIMTPSHLFIGCRLLDVAVYHCRLLS